MLAISLIGLLHNPGEFYAMGHRWIVKCKKCGADITYKFGAEHHGPETAIG